MTIECPKCQTNNPNESKFCMECATPFEQDVDFTECKRTEKGLKNSEEKLSAIFDDVHDMIVHVNKYGRILSFNKRVEDILGYKRDEVIGKHFAKLRVLRPKDIPKILKLFRYSITEGRAPMNLLEMGIKDINGNIVPIEASTRVIRKNGKVEGTINILRDITERKKAEENLKLSEEKYRSLIESTDDLIYLVDKNYLYIFMNKKHAERFNLPFNKIIGRPYSEFHSKKQTEIFKKDVNKVLKTGNSITHEHKSERDDKFYLRTYSPVKNEKGKVITVNVISKDISELKQIEKDLQQSKHVIHKFAEYLQSAREKERALVASELHDEVGQALTCLKMDIFVIKNRMSKNKKEIPSQFQTMEKLLDDSIQKLRKIYSDLRPSMLEHFGIGEAMSQYVNDFLEQSGTKCTFNQDPEDIILDENRSIALYRIFQGVINNIKWHSQATKVDIRFEEKGPNLKLTIRDNGKGIREEQINSGESFGLIGMRERSSFLGGKLEIKGLPNKGTTVKLEIPLNPKNH